MAHTNIEFLTTLQQIVQRRLADRPDGSYTAELQSGGDKRIAQKVGEEAIELALAVTAGDRNEQLNEAADLVYHLLVLLACKDIGLEDVAEILRQRHDS